MVPKRRRACEQNIISEAVHGGGIQGTNNRVWWFPRVPPRSPHLNPMNFFLCGCLKQQVYATPPLILQDLQRRIRDVCADVTSAMPHRVQREVQTRVQMTERNLNIENKGIL
ncbi:hypothetical protein AVEN_44814-1 [Araneus ventricosus]|uniref:Tc1-like transposase DDE domain-containing protein n=1 Tax=Araneus ventricosus TaxID=182803 RepID=A0A4Y2PLY6_ARAVE|nr:hypothetical protein AVEN_44814-1 [Araneus ventricosus]